MRYQILFIVNTFYFLLFLWNEWHGNIMFLIIQYHGKYNIFY